VSEKTIWVFESGELRPSLDLDVVQRAETLGLEVVRFRRPRAMNRRRPYRKRPVASPQPVADLRASCGVRAATLHERIPAMPPKAIVPPADLDILLPASHNPYRAREAKPGSPSKTSLSGSAIMLNCAAALDG
jgi:hypothetical protein